MKQVKVHQVGAIGPPPPTVLLPRRHLARAFVRALRARRTARDGHSPAVTPTIPVRSTP